MQLRVDIRKGVYVENLTEFEVETVNDILKLLFLVDNFSDSVVHREPVTRLSLCFFFKLFKTYSLTLHH